MYDGVCTGFDWITKHIHGATECCYAHDLGGKDGVLLDCLMEVFPSWSWAFVAFAIAVMILFRPLYTWLQKKGLVK